MRQLLLIVLAGLACVPAAFAQGGAGGPSGDVSVRLFSTRLVEALTLVPANGNVTMRRCARCAFVPMRSAISVRHAGSGLTVDGVGGSTLELAGDLRIEEAGNRVAAAAGRWRVDVAHGEMRVIVTIPRERYVMAVLGSEAAADDPPAALQALAIVARSFALTNASRHKAEGFEVCDSTHCQAMRLGAVPARIDDAVRATAGETLWLGGARVPAYFTQHCGGMSEDAATLWGGPRKPWLVSHADAYCQRTPSQWHAEIAADDLREALAREGWALRGKLEGVRVLQKAGSGRAAKVEVVAGGQRVAIAAASFRFAINRSLGWNRLRSDWYTVSFSGGKAVFEGRGYGHGVGLCQAGAHAMALQKKGDAAEVAREILRFYFPGTTVRVGAADEGWKQREAAGWTLLSVAPDEALARTGDAAWVRAQALFSTPTKPHPVVRVFPDTDLFRQMTSEPGWVLGASRGDAVSLQPLSVVARHEPLADLLLHEFLHVLVEREAGTAAPLWLREGFVEALTGTRPAPTKVRIRPQEVDAALSGAKTWESAAAAHRAAGTMVQALIARHGLPTVRAWLRGGVPAGVLAR